MSATLADGISQYVAEQAVQWLIALHEAPADAGLAARWRQWYEADPEHAKAWRRIESVNHSLSPLQGSAQAGIARATLAGTSRRRRQAIKALALLCFGGGSVMALRQTGYWRVHQADLRTGTGERQDSRLADGSTVSLNTGSAIDILFSAHERRLRLLAGEALFRTAADAAGRPFVVETRAGEVQALGTRFLLRQYDDTVLAAVYEGALRVSPQHGMVRTLQAGAEARFSAAGMFDELPANPDRLAWLEGSIVADGMPLGDLLQELARYTTLSIECAPAVAGLRVSGAYPVHDAAAVAAALARTLPLEVHEVRRFWGARTLRLEARTRSS